ncbi:hypothetical protein EDC29_103198 [Marichromatium gracile]|uniref:Uncharacterized protein n=1 Tax=Marichromatium gracile TaxID=1048 RepID=A0A4R4AD38_MARGR|nr:hypothetical protein EDC29_103198 [Marichromatium gracile]
MIWENLLDTLLNLVVFAFIGVLVWLYVRDEGDGS